MELAFQPPLACDHATVLYGLRKDDGEYMRGTWHPYLVWDGFPRWTCIIAEDVHVEQMACADCEEDVLHNVTFYTMKDLARIRNGGAA